MAQTYPPEYLQNAGLTDCNELGAMMPTRTCVRGDRTFEVTLSGTPTGSDALWTVECVYDKSLNAEIRVPGMDSIVASTEDVAFADTCDRIGKWLRLKI